MNKLDKLINYLSPELGMKRQQARLVSAAYEAAIPGRTRKDQPDNSNADRLTSKAGSALRGYARNLEQNHDIAEGILKTMTNNIVGANGINVEPMPRRKDGTLNAEFAKQLLKFWNDWKKRPEVTWEHQWSDCERLLCRAWLRDGEAFLQFVEGTVFGLNHGTAVPLSVELIEADYLPTWYSNGNEIQQSIDRNQWGRARNYYVLKQHPEGISFTFNNFDFRVIPADKMQHLKLVTRFRQSRGVSAFATVLKRLEDIKDYEESERIAARVAAAMTAYVKRGTIDDYSGDTSTNPREFKLSPGMIIDGLAVGEEIGTIQSNRPSALLGDFRDAMVRAVACGVGGNYSSLSKKYDGNYSSQRQELVESFGNYSTLTDSFVGMVTEPVYERMVKIGILSGVIKVPADMDLDTLYEASYFGPKMPWVDPLKESRANQEMVSAGFKSSQQIIRDNGGNPDAVLEQQAEWQAKSKEKELIFSTMQTPPQPQPLPNQAA